MVNITLSLLEIWQAAIIGVARQIQAIRDGSAPKAGATTDDDWTKHVEGACGELAFAKHMNLYWTGAARRNANDVGQWHVRTRSRHEYDLIVRESDPDDARLVLVTGRNGSYVIRGWIVAGEAKRHSEWLQCYAGRHSAWFVPEGALTFIKMTSQGVE